MSTVPYAQRVAKPSGWWGMVVFVATEATLFGTLIGSYYDLRFRTPRWPPAGVPELKVAVPLILLAVLVSTSVPVQLASAFARAGRRAATQLALLTALVMQSGYLAMGDLGGPGPGGGNIQLHKGNASNTPPATPSFCPV